LFNTQEISNLSQTQKLELLQILEEYNNRYKYRRVDFLLPEKGSFRRELYPKQLAFFKAGKTFKERALLGANRPLSDDTLVCMANGTKKLLSNVVPGDEVLALDLKTLEAMPSKVIDIPYQGVEEVFEIITSRGGKVQATADHCFPIWTKSGSRKTIKKLQTSEIPTCNKISSRKGLISPQKIHFKSHFEDLLIHPYVLGCLLGDGCLGFESVKFSNIDQNVIKKFQYLCDFNLKQEDYCTYLIAQGNRNCPVKGGFLPGELNVKLNRLGLKVNGNKKFIPKQYLTADVESRKELLAGLIDTDGAFGEFTNKSEQLVKDFQILVTSLGGYCSYVPCVKTCTNTGTVGKYFRAYWRINEKLPLQRKDKQRITKRKCDYSRHPIESIKPIGKRSVRCITIDHPDHVFLINDYFATFNSGKSFAAYTETSYHAYEYPEWWEGKRFYGDIEIWVCGKTHTDVRDIGQQVLLGKFGDIGSGFIPKEAVIDYRTKPGVPNAISDIWVRRKDGGIAHISFKSYDQGRESFQGTAIHVVVFDEEPTGSGLTGSEIYSEALTRTMTTDGIIMLVFTPLSGWSPLVLSFLPDRKFPSDCIVKGKDGLSRWVINLTWHDAIHLSEKEKAAAEAAYLPHEREARMMGVPSAGAGKVYTTLESDFVVESFKIPLDWPRAYGMDVGWGCTAAIFAAYDEFNDVIYIYDEYYSKETVPVIHAQAIKHRAGDWMFGAIDPASIGAGKQKDGIGLLEEYRELGLNVYPAPNSVEAGIARIQNFLTAGRIKVFSHCQNFLQEYRLYARDDEGKITKKNDHLMDAWKYLMATFFRIMSVKPEKEDKIARMRRLLRSNSKDPYTGY
jgi:phage terminase large subunit-like protein